MSINSDDLKQQIELVCIERGLEPDEVIKAIETSIASAYRRDFGNKEQSYEAKFDVNSSKYSIFETTAIVDEVLNPAREITLTEARLSNPSAQAGDVIYNELAIDKDVDFGRIAAQVAKQVLVQAINNVRHSKVLQQFKDKIGDVVNVEIDYFKRGGYSVKIAQTTGFMNKENLMPIDRFKPGQIVKALIVAISEDDKGNSRITLSRTHPDFVKAIITNEIPEVSAGIVAINKIVREAGNRTKILVSANEDENIDPVGTILGRKNVRITNIMREISSTLQEKIDVIENKPENIENMIMDALEPAEIERIELNDKEKSADVFCYPDEASLAVGKKGVNIRLASELLGWQLNIKSSDSEYLNLPEIIT